MNRSIVSKAVAELIEEARKLPDEITYYAFDEMAEFAPGTYMQTTAPNANGIGMTVISTPVDSSKWLKIKWKANRSSKNWTTL